MVCTKQQQQLPPVLYKAKLPADLQYGDELKDIGRKLTGLPDSYARSNAEIDLIDIWRGYRSITVIE